MASVFSDSPCLGYAYLNGGAISLSNVPLHPKIGMMDAQLTLDIFVLQVTSI